MESTENNQPAKETFEWWYISNDKDFPVIKNQVGLRQFNLADMEKAWTASADNSSQKIKELETHIQFHHDLRFKELSESSLKSEKIRELEAELASVKRISQARFDLNTEIQANFHKTDNLNKELEATIKLQLERMEAKENEHIKKEIELETKLALAEGEWKTYATSCESLSKKLGEANEMLTSSGIDELQNKLKGAIEALTSLKKWIYKPEIEQIIDEALKKISEGNNE